MKKTTKFLTLFLSLVLGLNSMVVYGESISDQPAFEEPVSNTAESATALAADNKEEPEIREEIVEWREEGVRHYYLGNGLYQAVVSPTEVSEFTSSSDNTRDSQYSSGTGEDTYINFYSPTTNYGASDKLFVSDNHITFFHGYLPILPENADIVSARMYFSYYYYITSGRLTVEAYPVQFYWEEYTLKWDTASTHENFGLGTESLGTAILPGTQTITQTHINITSAVKSWYECKKINDFGIALKRKSGSNSSVILVPREATSGDSPYYEIFYTLADLPIVNGTYYVQSVAGHPSGMLTEWACLMQTSNASSDDDDDDNNVPTGVNFCELESMTGESNQQWVFEYLHNGYYTIKSRTGNQVLAVQSGKENIANEAIIREVFTGDIRQQWKITLTSNGSYKIKPRSSELYVSDWVMGITRNYPKSGRNINQVEYNGSNGYFNDEWFLRKTGSQVFMLCINETDDRDRFSSFMEVMNCTGKLGYNTFDIQRGDVFTKSEIRTKMENAQIYVSRSHGQYFANGTCIIIDKNNSNNDSSKLTYSDVYTSETTHMNLDGCELMLFAGCYTAATNNSICRAAVLAGANCAIGFTGSIDCDNANKWVEFFFKAYESSMTSEEEEKIAECKYAADYPETHQYRSGDAITSSKIFFNEEATS